MVHIFKQMIITTNTDLILVIYSSVKSYFYIQTCNCMSFEALQHCGSGLDVWFQISRVEVIAVPDRHETSRSVGPLSTQNGPLRRATVSDQREPGHAAGFGARALRRRARRDERQTVVTSFRWEGDHRARASLFISIARLLLLLIMWIHVV